MSVKITGTEYRADKSLCGWGNCQAHTDGHPICTEHLRKAWAIVQADLNVEQQLRARTSDGYSTESAPLAERSQVGVDHPRLGCVLGADAEVSCRLHR